MYPAHEVIEKNGRRIYERTEYGGSVRSLMVWSIEGCRKRLEERAAQGQLAAFWMSMQEQLALHCAEGDPMMHAWFTECWNNCETIYEELSAKQEAILEEFGAVASVATIEDFGFELEEFGS